MLGAGVEVWARDGHWTLEIDVVEHPGAEVPTDRGGRSLGVFCVTCGALSLWVLTYVWLQEFSYKEWWACSQFNSFFFFPPNLILFCIFGDSWVAPSALMPCLPSVSSSAPCLPGSFSLLCASTPGSWCFDSNFFKRRGKIFWLCIMWSSFYTIATLLMKSHTDDRFKVILYLISEKRSFML